jgi:phosphatidylglycerophosphatase C
VGPSAESAPTGVDAHVAAFDFDGTLSRRDTLVPFLARVGGRRRFAAVCARLGLSGVRGGLAIRNRDDVKAAMLRHLFEGRSEDELRTRGELYARDLLSDQLRPMVLDRLHRHRDAGHRTLIVSASLVYYLEPLAAELGIDGVIGVEPEVSDGVLTGALARPNVRAGQKAVRLREWLDAPADGPIPETFLWGYGNSSGDHQLLALAQRAYWLGRPTKVPPGAELLTPETPLH